MFTLTAGVGLIGYAGYHIFKQKVEQDGALQEAKAQIVTKEPHTKEELSSYSFEKGDVVGILDIPALDRELPIIEGTDEEELEKGVGHYSSTKLPNQQDRIFLAGHRDTVFKKMGELKEGDQLNVEMSNGTYTYEIYEMFIVKEDDMSVVQSTNPDEILTLSTCYPFEYLSSTEERYIINAKRVD
ncbi:class D sortase [Rossellomorea vietnamensis]|uniref:Class D sortase n=1 Tax=Rossellomorea vietnamensis TaxID=218284 RepID=A0A5D4KDD5_9BACI|nr:class D sortase [Rossellomorea vietnamensis]